jgi:predicted secreted protein
MKQRLLIIAISALVAIIPLIGGCETETEDPQADWDPTKPYATKIGKEFKLTFESNRAAGYQWRLAEPLDEDILELKDTVYEAPDGSAAGAAGNEHWTFKAVGQGETQISMEYVGPEGDDVPPEKAGAFTIIVE